MKIVQPITINDAALLSTNVAEVLYPNWDPGYIYPLGARVHVVGPDLHKVYESLVDNNVGNTPATSSAKWVYVSATNPWLMFDKSVTSQTAYQDSIEVSIQAKGRVPCLTLLNVSALEVHVTMTDAVAGLVYDKTHSLVSDRGVRNWYDYFFSPITRLTDLVITDMPLYASPIVNVTLSAPGEEVRCGTLILGPITYAGETEHGATVGIQDFSRKERNEFGDYEIVERAYSKRGTFPVIIKDSRVDTLQQFLASIRSTPALYIGADSYTSTAIYGFYKDSQIQIAYPTESVLDIEIEGLT